MEMREQHARNVARISACLLEALNGSSSNIDQQEFTAELYES
jgi:hypothetical protein